MCEEKSRTRGMRFSLRGTKDGMMRSTCELQGKERLLNTSHNTLIIGAVFKTEQATSRGWAVSQRHERTG